MIISHVQRTSTHNVSIYVYKHIRNNKQHLTMTNEHDVAAGFDPFSLFNNASEEFDPFGLQQQQEEQQMPMLVHGGDDNSTASPDPPPRVTRLSSHQSINDVPKRSSTTKSILSTTSSKGMATFPPKLVVKFVIHEEVSSTAKTGVENEGASDIYTEGNLSVRATMNEGICTILYMYTHTDHFSCTYCRRMHSRMSPLLWFPIHSRVAGYSFFPIRTMCCRRMRP